MSIGLNFIKETSELINFACDGVFALSNQGIHDGNLLVPNK